MPQSTVIHRFTDTAARHPDRIAILGEDADLTYASLAQAAGGHAAALVDAGLRAGDRVALLVDHGVPAITAILGVLAAGGVHVPLDPGFPEPRLRQMLAAAQVTTVLSAGTHEPLARRLCADRPGTRVVRVDDLAPAPLRPVPVDPDASAYVLFTSGSTGQPKGVAQTHRNLLHVVDNQIDTLAVTCADRLSLLASFSFDAAIADLWPALLTGAAVLPVDLRRHGVGYAVELLARHRVTIYHSTPTVYRYLLDALGPGRLANVRIVLLGGERADHRDATRGRDRFGADCVLVNGYGATEMTFVAQYRLPIAGADPERVGPLPIGTALPGYELTLRPAPDAPETEGAQAESGTGTAEAGFGTGQAEAGTGEIEVRSRYLAPGYLDQPSDRFSLDADGVRRYRTGDLGRRLPDGDLVCLGRLDRQVKVRGFRVELAEVEAALAAEPGVGAVRAVVRDGELLAYAVPADDRPDPVRLRAALAGRLPEYALPRAVVLVDAFPLTVTGKVDERALPDPPLPASTGPRPQTPTEQAVHDIWCAVLGRTEVGLTDSFFDLGGQSLLLGQVQQRLAERFGRPVPMLRLFAHPTVAAQARLFDTPPAGETSPRASGPEVEPVDGVREYTGDEIAVVGLAGRFPGAPDVNSFWWNLCAGVDSIHDHTDEELAALGIGPGLRADPRHVRASGVLPGVEDFDADFFAFGAAEAARTDPQHRIFLETAWEALEDAGHDPARFPGLVGVFAATSVNRYFLFHLMDNPAVVGEPDPDDWEARLVGRQLTDHLPGQVAYRLGLTGPAVATQSACSSSLVAVCVAAQSLADYQCDIAIAGGVNVTWPRHRHTPGGLASPDGRCRAFDEAAGGAGFGSGTGAVVLRRLADARADGDRIHAILPGWAVTNDGADRAGYAVPGPAGQAAAVAGALAAADVAPGEVRFIEAHGSGTPLGDAIEVAALHEVYEGAAAAESCALGSVKTNIGHLDAGAGIAGLIKAVLAVRHGVIPPNLHFTRPHPEIDLAGGPFYVPTKVRDWPQVPRRVAGVSSFGLGGTNAHVVVEQAPPVEPVDEPEPTGYLLPVSARTPAALREALRRLRAHLATATPALADVAWTLAVGRQSFACRAVVAATALAEAVTALDRLLDTDPSGSGTGAATDPSGSGVDPSGTAVGSPGAGAGLVGVPAELHAVAAGWVAGREVDWAALHPGGGRRTSLPSYPFQRTRYWIDPPTRKGPR